MEFSLFHFLVTVPLCFLFHYLLKLKLGKQLKYPPGPPSIPILTSLQWIRKGFSDFEPTILRLRSKYGPIISLQIGRRKAIFISSHDLAHKALITHGSTFADRPPPPIATRHFSGNQHTINTAGYGTLWRLLRRNLTSEILHPSRVKSYSHARKWVLDILVSNLKHQYDSGRQPVFVMENFQYAMFCLLVLMCFGDKLDDKKIREVETVQRDLLMNFTRFSVLNIFPKLGKILFRKRWSLLYEVFNNQERVLLPLIQARREKKKENGKEEETVAYVDTLLNLTLPEEGGRKLKESEMVGLCSEFLNAGTDTTSTALQWIMANLVKQPEIQEKIVNEIKSVRGGSDGSESISEEEVQKMPYLKAVVLEGLRRHPPGHFLLPHSVTEDVKFEGYDVPKDGTVNVLIAEMGWDPKVWEDPMNFKPDRFLSGGGGDVFDITGSREIKMMPFGAGRRICPGLALALLHLEYFVANLVWEFEWKVHNGDDVDLSEKTEFTVVMKNPLRAHISPRKV